MSSRVFACSFIWRILMALGVALCAIVVHGAEKEVASPLLLAEVKNGGNARLAADSASGGNIAVLYPETVEPYRSVFSQILDGIEDRARNRVIRLSVNNNSSSQDIQNELYRQDVRAVIALGRNGLKVAQSLSGDNRIVVGGLLALPDPESRRFALLSLAPSPQLMFERLRTLAPEISRVVVVYDGRNSGWLIRLAREAARASGLELVAHEVPDLATAMNRYQASMAGADPRREALWLPQDLTTVDDGVVLPMVLQESWTRGIVVFSSNLAHVKRGVLFTLYPDTLQLGRNLANMAFDSVAGSLPAGQAPLRDVLGAVNLRTASHLGLRLSNRQIQSFSLTFPEP